MKGKHIRHVQKAVTHVRKHHAAWALTLVAGHYIKVVEVAEVTHFVKDFCLYVLHAVRP